MVKKYQFIIVVILLAIFFNGCSTGAASKQDELLIQYNKGIEFYNNKKFSKAKDAFDYVILHSAGSRLALESEFYLAESLYNLEEYGDALFNYDSYARSSQDYKLIELARFRLCQCAYQLSGEYNKDQTTTIDALDKIEIFLEDYSSSEYYDQIIELKEKARNKLAKKEYESARLYMKLEEYDAALIYLLDILNNYNDTDVIDDVRLMIIFAYILDDRHDFAMEFYNLELNSFKDVLKAQEALDLIESTRGGVKISQYMRLFK